MGWMVVSAAVGWCPLTTANLDEGQAKVNVDKERWLNS